MPWVFIGGVPVRRRPTVAGARQPLIIAHRGGSNIAPEDTLEAYRAAYSAGSRLLEPDCVLLADGELGVMHDATVDRTTTGTGAVSTFDTAAWRALDMDAGSWFCAGWPTLHPPLLGDVLAEFGKKAIIVPEVKTGGGDIMAQKIVARGLTRSCIVQSFVRAELTPSINAGIPVLLLSDAAAEADLQGVTYVGISTTATQAYIDSLLALGKKPIVYTINRHTELDAWLAKGCVGCFSDDPIYISRKGYQRLTDPFASGTFYHGHIAEATDRGKFVDGRWGWPTATGSGTKQNVLQGWASPYNLLSYTITATITFDAVPGAGWAGIFFAGTSDAPWTDNGTGAANGYHVIFDNAIRRISLYRVTNGAATQLVASGTGAAIEAGQSIVAQITVTPTGITATHGTLTVTSNDTTHRGGYLRFSRKYIGVTFSNVSIA